MEPFLLWISGLSGSGKTSLALALKKELEALGYPVFLLDGDDFRKGLSSDLDFSREGRRENIRRAACVSELFLQAGFFVITAFVSPYEEDRALARQILQARRVIEVYLDCPLEVCQKRDSKGLYAKAKSGKIQNFSGWDAPFEPPKSPDIILETDRLSLESCTKKVLAHIKL